MMRNGTMVVAVGLFGMLAGASASAGTLGPLVVEGVVHAPIADVWDAFYDEDEREWMTPECSIDLRNGGLIKCSYVRGADLDGDQAIQHRIIAFEHGRRMVSELVKGPATFPHTEAMVGSLGIFELDPIGANATRVRSVILGLRDDTAGRAAYNYFEEGNASTFDAVKEHLERPDQAQRTDRALELLARLIGGEWVHEGTGPDGNAVRVRNVVRQGPDGVSLVSNGWLGFGDAGMHDHGPTVIWNDADGLIRFISIHENGVEGSGTIRLSGDTSTSDSVEWDWWSKAPDGTTRRSLIQIVIPAGNMYTFFVMGYGPDGVRSIAPAPMEFHRYEQAPVRFRTLTTGEVIASASAATEHRGMDHGKRIEVTETIHAPVADVWRSWTTSEGMTAFVGAPSEIELRRGGKFEIYFDEHGEPGSRGSETCEVLSYVPGRMLSFTWNAPPKFENARFIHTWVVVELTPISAGQTRVTLTHCGWDENLAAHPQYKDEWDGTYAYFQAAWPKVMAALKSYHANH